ncbi:MAG: SUMF1/EgtB/PvdO family nonheme iron enzyme [Planctomycetes bacterium]|nr:SUMF1/EgtB/PvdO family nonheme iron enzyme [Planctomycetota bacterium]
MSHRSPPVSPVRALLVSGAAVWLLSASGCGFGTAGIVAAVSGGGGDGGLAPSAPRFNGSPPTLAVVDSPWSYTPAVTGNPGPDLSLDGAPAWLGVNGGTIAGTPPASALGELQFVITATNGVPPDATQQVTLEVLAAGEPPTIAGNPPTIAPVGMRVQYAPVVTGDPAPELILVGETVSTWLAVVGHAIEGTPPLAAVGRHVFTIRVSNGLPPDAAQQVALEVVDFGVPIPAGSFAMGSNTGWTWNQPVHTVNITRPFWMGRHEVTQARYLELMASNPSWFQPPLVASYEPNRPVERVSRDEAMAYCAALTTRESAANRVPAGYQYRLPTEAEWEYCCRAGTTADFNVGGSLGSSLANFGQNRNETAAVGSYAPNDWGLYDMHGNVWEWCLDSWDSSTGYPSGPVSDPYVAVASPGYPVQRGGSWNSQEGDCRSWYRAYNFSPANRVNNLGFRVVLAPILP